MKNKWQYPEDMDHLTFNKEHQKKVLNHISEMPKEKRGRRLRVNPVLAAIATIFLMANFWLFQEGIQQVLAKIPYISQFLEEEEDRSERMGTMLRELQTLLDENGVDMPNWNLEMNSDKKVFTVELKGWSGQDDGLREQILDIMEKNGFSDYRLSIVPYEESKNVPVKGEDVKQIMKDSDALKESVTKRLQEEKFELMFPVGIQMNPTQGVYINVIVPKTETRLDLLEKIIMEEGQQYGENPEIDIRQVEKKAREQEVRWEQTGAVHHIARAMMESDTYPVTGFSYSFHPYPLHITIKTSLHPDKPDAKLTAEEIRSEIKLYIDTGEGTEPIRGDEYEIRVLGKEKKEIE
ncbi:hypothetical protein QTG56_01310 [Rossellomorea sp. AcN35-11]|nr:hypothetical protein [Rossellomorea aquimaris]WJV29834.1 hypothetical protein QTG56_01310 [Rossellomorea sp. AcN35-11]